MSSVGLNRRRIVTDMRPNRYPVGAIPGGIGDLVNAGHKENDYE